jgi:predicted MPP superfamily phosphohydrolase
MALRQLTLRFRDASAPGHGAIAEHQELLAIHGRVLWGWWKREDEVDRSELWGSLSFPLDVTLVSTSEQLQYRAQVARVELGQPSDPELVPAYYRANVSSIAVWFELLSICEETYEPHLNSKIGGRLNTAFSPSDLMAPVSLQEPLRLSGSSGTFVCISDIHLDEAEHSFLLPDALPVASKDPSASERLVTLAQAIAADLRCCDAKPLDGVLVCGDIVSKGKWPLETVVSFFQDLSKALHIPLTRIFCVPGNHDFFRSSDDLDKSNPLVSYEHEHSYRAFRSQAFGVQVLEPLSYSVFYSFQDFELRFGFLNSARWTPTPGFTEYGFVGRDAYLPILEKLAKDSPVACWKMVVLHHHLLPVQCVEKPGRKVERPVSITLDSVDLLADAQARDVDLVISGHQHSPDLKHVRQLSGSRVNTAGTYVLTGGSSGSMQIAPRGWNTYTLLEFIKDKARCRVRELDPANRHQGSFLDIYLERNI